MMRQESGRVDTGARRSDHGFRVVEEGISLREEEREPAAVAEIAVLRKVSENPPGVEGENRTGDEEGAYPLDDRCDPPCSDDY